MDNNRSNGPNPKKIISEYTIIEEKKEVESKPKNNKRFYLGFIALVSLFIVSLVLSFVIKNDYTNLNSYSNRYTREVTRYAKNLNRLFTYFDGYNSEFTYATDEEENRRKELEKKQIDLKELLDQDISEIEDKYDKKIKDVKSLFSGEGYTEESNDISLNTIDNYIVENLPATEITIDEGSISLSRTEMTIASENEAEEFITDVTEDEVYLTQNSDLESEIIRQIRIYREQQEFEIMQHEEQFYMDMEILEQEYTHNEEEYSHDNHAEIKLFINTNKNFTYYIFDEKKNIAYSNINGIYEEFKINDNNAIDNYIKRNILTYISLTDLFDVDFANYLYRDSNGIGLRKDYVINSSLKDGFALNGISGYIMVPKDNAIRQEPSYDKKQINTSVYLQNHSKKIIALPVILLLLLIIVFTKGGKNKLIDSFVYYNILTLRIPLFIKIIGLIGSGLLLLICLSEASYNYLFAINIYIIMYVTTYVFVFLLSIVAFGIVNKDEEKELLKKEKEKRKSKRNPVFVIKLLEDFRLVFNQKEIVVKLFYIFAVIVLFIGTLAEIIVIVIIFDHGFLQIETIFLTLLYFCCLYIWIKCYRLAISYYRLKYAIDKIYEGEEIDLYSDSLTKTSIMKLKNIEQGFLKSFDEMVKSEKMKAELITNVSHDLKTPLTSIINYVELLDSEGLGSNNAPDYLKVLQQKSQRLKLLIEDLFEVSKLTTGNVELQTTDINVVDLLNQTVGELQNKIDEANIDLKFNYSEDVVMLKLDGKKMWRVFENLLNNIIKYSMNGSRAYINLEVEKEKVVITFRNISSQEIDFEVIDLFERFKRGDDSRSTDGNGLGLSIAQSIVQLHNGEMDIVLDGDLFKVIIILEK